MKQAKKHHTVEGLRQRFGDQGLLLGIGIGLVLVALFAKVLLVAGIAALLIAGLMWYAGQKKEK